MKSCSRCYVVVTKLFDIKEITALSSKFYTPFVFSDICYRCKCEMTKGILALYEVEEK